MTIVMERLLLRLSAVLLVSCIDQLNYQVPASGSASVSISGFVSDQNGPHRVTVYETFDIESRMFPRKPISLCLIYLIDDQGLNQLFNEIEPGIYELEGVHGQVGRAYKIIVELPDGRVYESVPDILPPPGNLDSLYFTFDIERKNFEIFFDATLRREQQFLWTLKGTFQATTRPHLEEKACYLIGSFCNFKDPCSGIRNLGTNWNPNLVQVETCTCCKCWYDFFNQKVFVSDFVSPVSGKITGTRIYDLALNGWVFMEKVRLEVSMRSLSSQAFTFWKTVKEQQEGVSDLFQPLGGRIPSAFIQTQGEKVHVYGLFYATSIATKVKYVYRSDVPYESLIPSVDDPRIGTFSCLKLFPNATKVRPSFWE